MHRRIPPLLAAFLLLSASLASGATTTIERQFTYDAAKLRVVNQGGSALVQLAGAAREKRSGLPDLPWHSESVELAPGQRIVSVEVTAVQTRALANGVHVEPAVRPTPGLGPVERTAPDAGVYASAVAQPAQVVELGAQGMLRGRTLATLAVSGAQWNPATGELRAVTQVSVKLVVEDGQDTGLERERIVPEWEDAGTLPAGPPVRGRAVVASAAGGAGGKAVPFRATQLPSVLGSPVAYVIVTNDAMAPVFQQLADWKTQTGLPAVVRTVSFIQGQYPSAADDAERIRLFLRDAYTRWGAKWVLLGGDTDVIPVRYAYNTFYDAEMIATDLYYSCLDGNWNADGDSLYGEGQYGADPNGDNADMMPEVYVGRAPVTTPADAQVFVDKTLQYEKTPLGTYEDRWMFFAEVLFPEKWQTGQEISTDGAAYAEGLLENTDLEPSLHVARLYQNNTDPQWRPGVVPETRQAVLDSINAGYGLGLHIGHGYRNVMEVGDATLSNPDALGLTNGDKLMNLYSLNCTSVAIDFPCIGEAFLLDPNGGAVTNVGSSRLDFPGTSQVYQFQYFQLFLRDSVTAVGELTALQKVPYLPWTTFDGADRWTHQAILELGDPELRMWRGKPRTLTVNAPATMTLADTTITVQVLTSGQPLPNARVTAYRAGNDFESGLTDATGSVVLPFRPDSAGGLVTLTVTAFNAHPWQAALVIAPTSAPTIVKGPVTLVDDGSGGTIGDGNASLDAGESVDVRLSLLNRGGSTAPNVKATLTTTDGTIAVTTPTVTYGSIASGGTVTTGSPATGFRISVPASTADQREVPFQLVITDGAARSWRQFFTLTVHAPELRTYTHTETEPVGNGDGRPATGETVNYGISIRNEGSGAARGVSLRFRSADGLASVTDSVATLGTIAPGATVTGDAVTFVPLSTLAKFTVVLSGTYGAMGSQTLDLGYPGALTGLLGIGRASGVELRWAHSNAPDLLGYNVYRSATPAGPFGKVNLVPTDRTAYYVDGGLAPLTQYWYRVTAVDSSGNESAQSTVAAASTNPPTHSIFPVSMGRTTPSSVALESIYSNSQTDIVAGSDVLYVLHADGTAPVDGDGAAATLGDFSRRGSYFASGPSVAQLEPGQGFSIIGASWDSTRVYVFDPAGNVRPGWPFVMNTGAWSSVAIGDLDGDGKQELVLGSNSFGLYVLRSNGTEWMDGDNNPTTQGVFKTFGLQYNYSSPALADLDGDGKPEIIYGARDGNLYAWKANGTLVPGFPYHTSDAITSSVAVGFLDGPADVQPELVFTSYSDTVYVVEANGQGRPGWPKRVIANGGTERSPTPAIADMNNDGLDDIVVAGIDGVLHCWSGSGVPIASLDGDRFSALTAGATESSPVVADINGDGWNDVVIGDENAQLTAFSGATGQVLAGFPIQLSGEVRGTPALGDIDRDGKTEIVLAGWDKNLYVWDYDFPFQPTGVAPWPQFMHDARRTGYSRAPLYVADVNGGPASATAPRSLAFAPPSPNPARGRARMEFGVPVALGGQTYELAIFDLTGRRVSTVDRGIARAGTFSLTWDLRDAERNPVRGGVYFARFAVGAEARTQKLVVMP